MKTRVAASLIAMVLVLHFAVVGQASYQAEIRGIVSDSSGALVPNATVTLTELGTGVDHVAQTDSSGSYTLRALRPSSYALKVEAPGFQAIKQRGIVLQVNQQTSLNFTLRLAGTSTKVEVTEATPLLDTQSSSLGTDVTNQYVKEILQKGKSPPSFKRPTVQFGLIATRISSTHHIH